MASKLVPMLYLDWGKDNKQQAFHEWKEFMDSFFAVNTRHGQRVRTQSQFFLIGSFCCTSEAIIIGIWSAIRRVFVAWRSNDGNFIF